MCILRRQFQACESVCCNRHFAPFAEEISASKHFTVSQNVWSKCKYKIFFQIHLSMIVRAAYDYIFHFQFFRIAYYRHEQIDASRIERKLFIWWRKTEMIAFNSNPTKKPRRLFYSLFFFFHLHWWVFSLFSIWKWNDIFKSEFKLARYQCKLVEDIFNYLCFFYRG